MEYSLGAHVRICFLRKIQRRLRLIFEGDEAKVAQWLEEPNEYFLGKKPLELISAGEGQHLVDFLDSRI